MEPMTDDRLWFKREPIVCGVPLFGNTPRHDNHALRNTLTEIFHGNCHTGVDRIYFDAVQEIVRDGTINDNRTDVPTVSKFGLSRTYNANDFLLKSKKVHTKSIIVELCWFLRGETNVKYLHDHGVTIWDEWAPEDGDLGPVYGHQWRAFGERETFNAGLGHNVISYPGVDQIKKLIEGLVNNPGSRRHIVNAWNPAEADHVALPPCHVLFQLGVDKARDQINMTMYQRSADFFLGVPFNIASYCMLLHMIVNEVNGMLGIPLYTAGNFHHAIGDAHIYVNHAEQIVQQYAQSSDYLPAQLDLTGFSLFDPKPDHQSLESADDRREGGDLEIDKSGHFATNAVKAHSISVFSLLTKQPG
mgnify:CR=1 FL=1